MKKRIAAPFAGCALALVMVSLISCGGEDKVSRRENFDFGWSFRYFGPGDPMEEASPVRADSTEHGKLAAYAIDGDLNTRWCAENPNSGHNITLETGVNRRIQTVQIHWENAKPQEIVAELSMPGRMERRVFLKESEVSIIEVGGRPLSSLKLTCNNTKQGNWASVREIILLDTEGHRVTPRSGVSEDAPAQPQYLEAGFKKVQLPHDWAIGSAFLKDEPNETGKLPWSGYGWYRKNFDVPADFSPDKDRYYLDFEGVMANPKVYVNGRKAGEWAYGYTSFRVDITPYLNPGQKNLVAVLVSNKPRSTRWYPGAGIYRHVWLQKSGVVHLAYNGVFVSTPSVSSHGATVNVQTEVDNTGRTPVNVIVQQKVGDISAEPVEVTVEPGHTKKVVQNLHLPKPTLWSCENPHLYTLETLVTQDGVKVDARETNFGVRTIEWRPSGFFLNGKRVPLNGVCEHHDLGPLGAAFHARAFERKIKILKGMGCNSIRMAHNPPAPEALDLCDKHGILVLDELFDVWKLQKYDKVNGYHVNWPEWWKKDVANIIRRDRNHPCVIAWSGGNEVNEITAPEGKLISSNLRNEILAHDPTRYYTVGTNAAQGAFNGFGDTQDTFGYNYKPWLYKKYATERPNMPFYGSETASCVATRDTYFFPLEWNVGGGASAFQVSAYGLYAPSWGYCPDVEFYAQDQEPRVAGEYVWTGFDYLGEPTPYNQDASNAGNLHGMSEAEKRVIMSKLHEMGNKAPSRSSYFGIIDLAGFPKDNYYLYMSRWAPEKKHAHLLPHWNWKGREGQVTPVMCFSSGDEAELFVNGVSQGVRRKGEGPSFSQAKLSVPKNAYRFVWEEVKYEPGEIKVVVKKDGKLWAEAKRVTTGNTAAVRATVDHDSIVGDGHDLAFISLALVDKKDNVVPTDSRDVSFSIEGPADLVGFCNGNPIDQTSMQSMKQSFFNGRIIAVVRSERGQSGKAIVTVKVKGLPDVKVPITVSRKKK